MKFRPPMSREQRARVSAATKLAMANPEVRARISERTKAALADPEVKARQSANTKAALARPGVRDKISVGTKAGMQLAAQAGQDDLAALNTAWNDARPDARRRFLKSIWQMAAVE
jgi:hypothetical protein